MRWDWRGVDLARIFWWSEVLLDAAVVVRRERAVMRCETSMAVLYSELVLLLFGCNEICKCLISLEVM